MPQFGQAYQNLCDVQNALIARVLKDETESRDAALCAREIREIESYKRELRGKPRLKAVDATLLLRNARAPRDTLAAPVEVDAAPAIDEAKESLNCQTVTAPPTPEPPTANG